MRPRCEQCGRPLQTYYHRWFVEGYGEQKRAAGHGYEGNGRFCTIRCGYRFAIGVRPDIKIRRL